MSTINYAIQITTDQTSVTDTDYGCTAGVFRYITGRPGYGGSPTYPTGETGIGSDVLQAVWYEGWIEEYGIGAPSRSIDVTISGDYGTLSGFDFSIAQSKATDEFWRFVYDNEMRFTNRQVQLYAVIDDVFYYLWNGVVDTIKYNEMDYQFSCKDKFRAVHKQLPRKIISETEYENASDDSLGNAIPVSMGDVARSRLQNIEGKPNFLDLAKYGTATDPFIVRSAYAFIWEPESRRLNLHTPGLASDVAAAAPGSWLFVTSGEDIPDKDTGFYVREAYANQYIKIPVGQQNTTCDIFLRGNIGKGYECRTINDGGGFVLTAGSGSYDDSATYPARRVNNPDSRSFRSLPVESFWNYKIAKLSIKYQVSDSTIQQLLTDDKGIPLLWLWSEDLKQFTQFNHVLQAVDLDNGILTLKTDQQMSIEGDIKYVTPIDVKLQWYPFMADPSDVSKLTDRDRTTYWETGVASYSTLGLRVIASIANVYFTLRDDVDYSKYEALYAAFDVAVEGASKNYRITHAFHLIDQYGNAVDDGHIEASYPEGSAIPDGSDYTNFIPNDYYSVTQGNNADEDSVFYAYNNELSDHDGTVTMLTDGDQTPVREYMKIPQQMLTAVEEGRYMGCRIDLNIESEENTWEGNVLLKQFAVFGEMTGELISDDLYCSVRGATTSDGDVPTNSVYGAMKWMLEDNDGISTSDIDYGNLAAMRSDWHVGRQITERKSSFDYIKELCNQSFVGLWPGRDGKRKLSAWFDNSVSSTAYDETDIVRDSIKSYSKTPTSKVFTDYYIKYNWDAAREKFTRDMFITRADESSLPAESSNWTDYVGGLPETVQGYGEAKEMWDQTHEAYLQMNMVTPELPKQYSDLNWYIDVRTLPQIDEIQQYTGTNSSAWKYLKQLISWTTIQKDVVEFSLPLTATNAQIELLDYVTFSDPIYTDDTAVDGWIVSLKVDPKKNQIVVKVMLKPDGYDDIQGGTLIIERGNVLNDDSIIERGSTLNTSTYTEQGV